jgi:hypothetical protein
MVTFTTDGDNFTSTPGKDNSSASSLRPRHRRDGNLAGDFIDILEVTDGGTVDPANLAGVSNIHRVF